jgi:hypothetical protein
MPPNNAELRNLLGNALTGAAIGLHDDAQLSSFFAMVNSRAGGARANWTNQITILRYPGGTPPRKFDIDGTNIPLHALSGTTNHIGSGHVYNVIPFRRMWQVISSKDKAAPPFAYLPDTDYSNPLQVKELAAAVKKIPRRYRSFELDSMEQLGYPVLWVTSESGRQAIDSGYKVAKKSRSFRGNLADWYSSVLGLGHRKAGDLIMLLKIPAAAVDRAGHFRPNFCDAVGHPWFMVGSSIVSLRTSGPWGQTADLEALRTRMAAIDGAPERVSRQLVAEDFDVSPGSSPKRMLFDILGIVSHDAGQPSMQDDLAMRIWRDRKA